MWTAILFDDILKTDNKFEFPMRVGSIYLSFFIKDPDKGRTFFDDVLTQYPNNGFILSFAAYHAMENEKDKPRAAALYERAAQNGAPNWTHALAVKLYAGAEMQDEAKALYESLKKEDLPEGVINSMKEQLHIKE